MNDPLATYTLAEIREALEAAAELTKRVRELEDDQWVEAEEAAAIVSWKSTASFVKTDAPRKYFAPRVIRYHKGAIKKWANSKPDG